MSLRKNDHIRWDKYQEANSVFSKKPQVELDQVVLLDLGDVSLEANSVQQLMVIERNLFLVSQEEDDILAAILTNRGIFL